MNAAQQGLTSLLAKMSPMVAVGITVPGVATEEQDLGVVSLALLRRAYVQAHAVLAVSLGEAPEAAVSNVRSAFEAAAELVHLLASDNPVHLAQVAFLYSLMELADFQKEFGEQPAVEKVVAEIAGKAAQAPDVVAEAETKKKKGFWPSKGRAALIEDLLASAWKAEGKEPAEVIGKQMYRVLSWDDHHVMAAMLTVQMDPKLPHYGQIKAQEAPSDPEEFYPAVTFGAMREALRVFRDRFPEHAT